MLLVRNDVTEFVYKIKKCINDEKSLNALIASMTFLFISYSAHRRQTFLMRSRIVLIR